MRHKKSVKMERRLFSSKTRPRDPIVGAISQVNDLKWNSSTNKLQLKSNLFHLFSQKINNIKTKVISCVRANRLKCNGNGHTHCHRNVNVFHFICFYTDLFTHIFSNYTHTHTFFVAISQWSFLFVVSRPKMCYASHMSL